MVGFTKNIVAITAALSFFGAAIAAPAPAPEVDYAKLIEVAPGYPTIEELGLTNADLTKPIPGMTASFVSLRFPQPNN